MDTSGGGARADSRPSETVDAINRSWRSGAVDRMRAHLSPEVHLTMPEFAGTIRGVEPFLAGFRDFVDNSVVLSFDVDDLEEAVVGETATVTYRFRFGYERDAGRYVGEGRDFWVLHRGDGGWLATHRVILEMAERAAE